MTARRTHKSSISRDAFDETERGSVTQEEVETAMRQVMRHAAKPREGSENRVPTKSKVQERWRMVRDE